MKKIPMTVIFLVLFFSGTLLTKHDTDYFARTCYNYVACLQSANNGVVFSTLINVMKMKYTYPRLNYNDIHHTLDSLSAQGKSERNCLIAQIVGAYLNNQIDLDWLAKQHYLQIHRYFDFLLNEDILNALSMNK
jgi:hypothetical protein